MVPSYRIDLTGMRYSYGWILHRNALLNTIRYGYIAVLKFLGTIEKDQVFNGDVQLRKMCQLIFFTPGI